MAAPRPPTRAHGLTRPPALRAPRVAAPAAAPAGRTGDPPGRAHRARPVAPREARPPVAAVRPTPRRHRVGAARTPSHRRSRAATCPSASRRGRDRGRIRASFVAPYGADPSQRRAREAAAASGIYPPFARAGTSKMPAGRPEGHPACGSRLRRPTYCARHRERVRLPEPGTATAPGSGPQTPSTCARRGPLSDLSKRPPRQDRGRRPLLPRPEPGKPLSGWSATVRPWTPRRSHPNPTARMSTSPRAPTGISARPLIHPQPGSRTGRAAEAACDRRVA